MIARARLLGLLVFAVGVACSDPHGGPSELADAAAPEAGDEVPGLDAGSEAGHDAEAGTEPPPTCTAQGWCTTALPNEDEVLVSVWADGTGVFWAVGSIQNELGQFRKGGSILRWNGTSWVIQHRVDTEIFAIWGSSPTDLWVGTGRGVLHGTGPSSAAIAWSEVPTPDGVPVRALWGSSANDIWAIGLPRGALEMTIDPMKCSLEDGHGVALHWTTTATWVTEPSLSGKLGGCMSVWGTGPDDVWMSSGMPDRNVVHHRGPDGAWAEVPLDPPPPPELPGVILRPDKIVTHILAGASASASHVWMVSTDSMSLPEDTFFIHSLYRTAVAPTQSFEVSPLPFGSFLAFRAAWMASPNDVWLAGSLGAVQHWNGAGFETPSVSTTHAPIGKDLIAIAGTGAGAEAEIFIVGDGVALRRVPASKRGTP